MAKPPLNPWRESVRFVDLARGTVRRRLEPDTEQRKALARDLGLDALDSFTAEMTVSPWLDGAQIDGRFTAEVTQTCGVSLDPFESTLSGDFTVRVLPAGSPSAPANDPADEIELDPDADDPPDIIEGDEIDLAAYAVEHLALEVDPFPRKPGAVFEPPPPEEDASPFAVLRKLKPDDSTQ